MRLLKRQMKLRVRFIHHRGNVLPIIHLFARLAASSLILKLAAVPYSLYYKTKINLEQHSDVPEAMSPCRVASFLMSSH